MVKKFDIPLSSNWKYPSYKEENDVRGTVCIICRLPKFHHFLQPPFADSLVASKRPGVQGEAAAANRCEAFPNEQSNAMYQLDHAPCMLLSFSFANVQASSLLGLQAIVHSLPSPRSNQGGICPSFGRRLELLSFDMVEMSWGWTAPKSAAVMFFSGR